MYGITTQTASPFRNHGSPNKEVMTFLKFLYHGAPRERIRVRPNSSHNYKMFRPHDRGSIASKCFRLLRKRHDMIRLSRQRENSPETRYIVMTIERSFKSVKVQVVE